GDPEGRDPVALERGRETEEEDGVEGAREGFQAPGPRRAVSGSDGAARPGEAGRLLEESRPVERVGLAAEREENRELERSETLGVGIARARGRGLGRDLEAVAEQTPSPGTGEGGGWGRRRDELSR